MIEPARLVSRLMTFVLAGCLTMLIILAATLSQMFPLERTQVFFLTSRPRADQIISIQKFDLGRENLDVYKDSFIKEYIIARNQITRSGAAMARKWDTSGLVYAYSGIGVYSDFMKTDLWRAIMEGSYDKIPFRCDVSFNKTLIPRKIEEDAKIEKYAVRFRYICTEETTGQSTGKDFTIAVSLSFQSGLNWNERLDNPLGLKVVGYEIEDGGDPLNTSWLANAAGGRQ